MENNDKKKYFFWKIFMYVYIIGVVVTVVLGPVRRFSKHGHNRISRDKACYSNIRVIQGAVEMYNMDHETMISSLSDAEIQNPTILKGYLKPVNHPESQCCYEGSDCGDGNVGIWGTYHGDVDGSWGKPGTYTIKQESFLSKIKILNVLKNWNMLSFGPFFCVYLFLFL